MARAKSTDFLHNFRFHVIITGFGSGGTENQLGSMGTPPTVSAGFNAVTTPEATHDAVEYREGHFIYTEKYVGIPTVSDITLSRGVALGDGTFWLWMKDVIEGNGEYRADMSIFHLHRDSKQAQTAATTLDRQKVIVGEGTHGWIEYKLAQAFPIRHKVSSDLDATASEVSIQELDLAIENFNVIDGGADTA
jgi:phage tail-like protein